MDQKILEVLFTEARTHSHWLEQDVPEHVLKEIYDLARFGPTSANCSPMRLVFVKSPEAKEKLKPCLDPGNVDKTMTAPVTAIVAYDEQFYDHLPKLFPHAEARSWFADNPDFSHETAFRNSALQGAYLIMAARSMGLDCGPMSGFDAGQINEAFFQGTSYKVNFLCNLGYGDARKLFPRSPRLAFVEACQIV